MKGRIECMNNGKPWSRTFDYLVIQRANGWTTRKLCSDRFVLGNGKYERVLYWDQRRRRRQWQVWSFTTVYLLGVMTGLAMR